MAVHPGIVNSTLEIMAARVSAKADRSESPYPTRIASAVANMRTQMGHLTNFHATPDPRLPKAAHISKTAEHAKRFKTQLTDATNAVIVATREGHVDITSQIADRLKMRPDRREAWVLGRFFRFDNDADKHLHLNELVELNDGPALAAILDAGYAVTGLKNEATTPYREMLASKHAADLIAERDLRDQVSEEAFATLKAAGQYADDYATPEQIQEIERAVEAANRAAAAMNTGAVA